MGHRAGLSGWSGGRADAAAGGAQGGPQFDVYGMYHFIHWLESEKGLV